MARTAVSTDSAFGSCQNSTNRTIALITDDALSVEPEAHIPDHSSMKKHNKRQRMRKIAKSDAQNTEENQKKRIDESCRQGSLIWQRLDLPIHTDPTGPLDGCGEVAIHSAQKG